MEKSEYCIDKYKKKLKKSCKKNAWEYVTGHYYFDVVIKTSKDVWGLVFTGGLFEDEIPKVIVYHKNQKHISVSQKFSLEYHKQFKKAYTNTASELIRYFRRHAKIAAKRKQNLQSVA